MSHLSITVERIHFLIRFFIRHLGFKSRQYQQKHTACRMSIGEELVDRAHVIVGRQGLVALHPAVGVDLSHVGIRT